jgi:DNA-directed RNA polymerase subunit RPC12/RpoP
MPRIVCFTCGRQLYTTEHFESLSIEERRCPRCGSSMQIERREGERRQALRRQNQPDDPGPPADGERRGPDRRTTRRRHDPEKRDRPGTGRDSVGWQD